MRVYVSYMREEVDDMKEKFCLNFCNLKSKITHKRPQQKNNSLLVIHCVYCNLDAWPKNKK